MERETGLEPATSSLGIHRFIESKSLARFCCEFLNLQRVTESAFFKSVPPNEARMRQVPERHFGGWDRAIFTLNLNANRVRRGSPPPRYPRTVVARGPSMGKQNGKRQ